jgi:threonine aldolase
MPATRARAPRLLSPDELRDVYHSCTRFLSGTRLRSAASQLALIPEDTVPDVYGEGGVVADLEADVAKLLGKEASLFFVTGTMAQQATLRVHADRRNCAAVAFHPMCHLDVHEERGYQRLHGLVGVQAGSATLPLTLADLERIKEPLGALLLELPQRDLGGTLPTFDELSAQIAWAKDRGSAVHLDGARLWEAGPYYERTAGRSYADVAALFDSVYVSFYKGLGAIAGCCVAGDADTIEQLKLWRIRHGGRAFGLWPYAAAARTALHERLDKFDGYARKAAQIGRALAKVEGIEVLPSPVVTPMMHLRLSGARNHVAGRMQALAKTEHVWMFGGPFAEEGPRLSRYEFNVGEPTMAFSVAEVVALFEHVLGSDR